MKVSDTILELQKLLLIPEDMRTPHIGPLTRGQFNALAMLQPDAEWGNIPVDPTPPPPPPPTVPPSSGITIDTIIDINHQNGMDLAKLKSAGICAIVHKVGQGTNFHDPLYQSRRAAAKAAGMLWGGYLFNSHEDPAEQAKAFIKFAQFTPDELMSFDWEQISGGNVTLAMAHTFIQTVFDLTGRYPMVYGSNVCREAIGDKTDELLAKCAFWEVSYRAVPAPWPKQVWPKWDLWQYDDGTNDPVPGSDGADRNKFQGSETELRAAWPNFTKIA